MKKYKLTINLGLKITAFVFSVFLWLIVVNIDNPVSSITYNNIPVTIVNDDIITSSGEVYQVVGEQTVSVVVYANRQIQQELTADDIVATADIREMDTSTGLVPITVDIPNYRDASAEAVPRNLQIQREKSGRKVFALTVETTGDERDGYIVGDMTVNPENVTITGAESTLEQIDRAVAQVDINGISEDEERSADLILFGKDGNVIGQNQLENNLGDEGITVSIEVLEQKTVPVTAEASGSPAEGYRYTSCTAEPESVQICGKSDVIADVEEIAIPASAISVNGARNPVEQTVDITEYLPDGVRLVDENAKNITVTAMVEQEGTRTIKMLVSSARITGLAENLEVDYEPDAEIALQFRGDQQALDVLDISNAVSIDLSDYTEPGEYEVPVEVNIPDGIELISGATVNLTLSEKTEEAPETSGQESD